MKLSISMQALFRKMVESGYDLPDHLFFLHRSSEKIVFEDEKTLVVEWTITYKVIGYWAKILSAYNTEAKVVWQGWYLASQPGVLLNASVNRVEIDIKEDRFLSWPRRPGLRKASRH